MSPAMEQVSVSCINCEKETIRLLASITEPLRFTLSRFPTALSFLEQFDPSVPGCAIADFNMPDCGNWELVEVIQAEPPGIEIIFLAETMDVTTAVELMKAGVADVYLKPFNAHTLKQSLCRAVETDAEKKRLFASREFARQHYTMLTPREREVFQLVVSGLPSKGIARVLDRSQKTVEVHRTSIMKKMAARSVVDLVRMGMELSVLDELGASKTHNDGHIGGSTLAATSHTFSLANKVG